MGYIKEAERKGLEKISAIKRQELELQEQKRNAFETALQKAKDVIALYRPALEPLFEELRQNDVTVHMFEMLESQYYHMRVGSQEGKPILLEDNSNYSGGFHFSVVANLEGITIFELQLTPLVSNGNDSVIEVHYDTSTTARTNVVVGHPDELVNILPQMRSSISNTVSDQAEMIDFARSERIKKEEQEKINRNKPFWKKIIKSNRK